MTSLVHPVENCGFARAYVISGSNGLMVVDVGSVGTARNVADYIKRTSGMSLHDVRYIAATHFHIDHIGGIGHFLALCEPETKVMFHHFVDDYLTGKRKLSLVRNWFHGLLPATLMSARYVRSFSHLVFESLAGIPLPALRNLGKLPYKRDRMVFFGGGGGARYRLGFEEWEVIETPGHTEDSVTFYHESSGDLICGDLIINMRANEGGRLNRFYWDRKSTVASYRLLCETTRPAAVYPGHGEVIRDRGDLLEKVRAFNA